MKTIRLIDDALGGKVAFNNFKNLIINLFCCSVNCIYHVASDIRIVID